MIVVVIETNEVRDLSGIRISEDNKILLEGDWGRKNAPEIDFFSKENNFNYRPDTYPEGHYLVPQETADKWTDINNGIERQDKIIDEIRNALPHDPFLANDIIGESRIEADRPGAGYGAVPTDREFEKALNDNGYNIDFDDDGAGIDIRKAPKQLER